MNQKLEEQLTTKYPGLYRYQGWNNLQSSLMGFGFEHGDGWFKILDELSEKIQGQLDLYDKSIWFPGLRRFVRKFLYRGGIPRGVWRFTGWTLYHLIDSWTYTYKGEFRVTQVKEKYGGLRYYTSGHDEAVEAFISLAEYEAHRTCEDCGQDGGKHGYIVVSQDPFKTEDNPVVTDDPTRWTYTKCKRCWGKFLTEDKELAGPELTHIMELMFGKEEE